MTRTSSISKSSSLVARYADVFELADAFEITKTVKSVDPTNMKKVREDIVMGAVNRFNESARFMGASSLDLEEAAELGVELVNERRRIRREDAKHRADQRAAALLEKEEREFA